MNEFVTTSESRTVTAHEIFNNSDVINKFNRIIHYNNMFNDKLGLDMFIYLTHNKKSFGKNMSKDIVVMCNKINALNDIINILEE